jgi:sugar O-acyltransferase (sialic acid O-acetyltransferase NeuD family)
MKKLVIVGAGLFAEVVRDYFHEYTDYRVHAFACHAEYKECSQYCGVQVLSIEELDRHYAPGEVELFVAIGYRKMNKLRQAVYEELRGRGYMFASFIAPDVKRWSSNLIGENVFIFEGNVIQPHVRIGDNTILWSGNHIGHHSIIGRHCFVSSHVVVSGSCKIGDNSFLGVNSTLHDGLSIGAENLIGAGAVVARDTRDGEVFVPSATKAFPKTSDQLEF